jgi:hypothetical protein
MAVSPVLTLISRSDRVIFSLSPPFFVGDSKMSELRAKKAKETGYVTIFTKPLELGELPDCIARAMDSDITPHFSITSFPRQTS